MLLFHLSISGATCIVFRLVVCNSAGSKFTYGLSRHLKGLLSFWWYILLALYFIRLFIDMLLISISLVQLLPCLGSLWLAPRALGALAGFLDNSSVCLVSGYFLDYLSIPLIFSLISHCSHFHYFLSVSDLLALLLVFLSLFLYSCIYCPVSFSSVCCLVCFTSLLSS